MARISIFHAAHGLRREISGSAIASPVTGPLVTAANAFQTAAAPLRSECAAGSTSHAATADKSVICAASALSIEAHASRR